MLTMCHFALFKNSYDYSKPKYVQIKNDLETATWEGM